MNAITRLAQAIGYPDRVDDGANPAVLLVDGREVSVREDALRLILSAKLDFPEERLALAAGYAAGRMLREEATLAWDPALQSAVLFQAVDSQASLGRLREAFGRFADSCDWWRDRAEEAGTSGPAFPEMVLVP